MPANNPLGYMTPEVLSMLLGGNVQPQEVSGANVYTPGQVDRIEMLAGMRGFTTQQESMGGELLRRIMEVKRTRVDDMARLSGERDQQPAGTRSYNPFNILSDVLGG
jgi:hypothetical protein